MAKRGFFAEMNYQAQQAEKRSRAQQVANDRARASAERELDRSRKAAERARLAVSRASLADQKTAEREAARLYTEYKLAKVASLNSDLARVYGEIDGLLAWTLEVDDHIDLESLRSTAEHPPFDAGVLANPTPAMPELVYPTEPAYVEPSGPSALGAAFGGKKRHQEAVERARSGYEAARLKWHEEATALHAAYVAAQARREGVERRRITSLAAAESAYAEACRQREAEVEARNQELDTFVNELAFDVESAIQQYVGIVLSNSVYPEAFPVRHDYQFTLDTRELTLTVTVPEPPTLPAVKEYKYVKAKDLIAATPLPVKAQKDRYAGAVWQVAVRTLHEVFEADRAGKVHSIALTVGVDRIAPATGRPESVPLVIVSADRESFSNFDLEKVVPQATLAHLGAAVSKSPFDVTPADTSRGVRARSAE
ncbi:hypothetical protein [Cellulomonas sp. P24]|uniref:hypothetical protein n=1 Tax=Cellulomonas sp. P24 TaxID=2885206 RepID=UPI00216AF01B|nr:hypothetical protein [Cellulomonas sp. P24]MCR6490882.1 hypothetical protein [Cellulomonas sp. P24]MCR6490905.1 hypothetical protein [Cellulomonas sp. P24]MCR6494776.1 hypothetical protein [Cellulomonas sp. P24]